MNNCLYCGAELISNRACEKAVKKFCSYSCQGSHYRKNTEKGWATVKLSRIKQSAASRGLEFNLTVDDLLPRPERCYYLGIVLDYSAKGIQRDSPSLNRIDNTKGYIKGNVEIISTKANTMLSDASREELLFFSGRVKEKYEDR